MTGTGIRFKDLQTLYRLVLAPVRGVTHAQRLESFYGAQAADYDDFRRRLLQGRRELMAELDFSAGEVWLDMGAGTGANLDFVAQRVSALKEVYLVDLCPSLLAVARQRISSRNWPNVRVLEADVADFSPPQPVDVITFSYSLTMMPDWIQALEQARKLLKPGGRIGVVDFYVSRKHPAKGRVRHNWFQRHFWPMWFERDNVLPCKDHLPYLCAAFEPRSVVESLARVPYLPGLRVPFYRFVGSPRS